MSFIGDFMKSPVPGLDAERDIKAFTGQTGAEASLAGAELQAQSAREGIDLQRETRDQLLAILQPYMELGYGNIDRLQQLSTQPGDQTALNAAAQLMGVTRGTPAVYEQPTSQTVTQPTTNQLLNKTGQPVNQLTDRRTIASTPNAAGRDVYGNMAITNNPTTQTSAPRSGIPQNTSGGRRDDVFMQVLQNTGDPAQAEAASRMAASGASVTGQSQAVQNAVNNARQINNQVQQTTQPVQQTAQQATQPAIQQPVQQPRLIQAAVPGSYNQVQRPVLDQFNQQLVSGRDTSALNQLTSMATANQANPMLDQLNSTIMGGRDTSALNDLVALARSNPDNTMLNQLNSTIMGGRDTSALNRLTSLTTDPNAQASFINDNPFYDSLARDSERRLLANQAARGKVGSGGTAVGLQDALVRLGSDLLQREIGNLSTADSAGLSSNQANVGNLASGVQLGANLQNQRVGNLLSAESAGLNANQANIGNLMGGVQLGSDLQNRQFGNLLSADQAGLNQYQTGLSNLGTGVGLNEGIRTGDINQLLQLQGFESGLRADDINSILQLVGMGQNAAAGQGAGVQNTGNNITSLLSSIGDAQAAGGIGAANAYGQGSQNVATAATALAGLFMSASDERVKKNKVKVGRLITDKGEYDYYTFDYLDGTPSQGVMAQQVEKINPEAVTEINGIKHVYYGLL